MLDPFHAIGIQNMDLGTFAVVAFFALSGMLVAPSFARTGNLFVFLWHRVLRIYPALIVSLLLIAGVLVPLTFMTQSHSGLDPEYASHALRFIGQNIILPNSIPRITNELIANPVTDFVNGSMWTLRYELVGYALIGLCGAFAGLSRFRSITWAVFAVSCLVGFHDALQPEATDKWFYTSTGKRMILIAMGGMVWATLSASVQKKMIEPKASVVAGLIAIGLLYTETWWIGFAITLPPLLHFAGYRLPLSGWEKRVGGDYSYGIYIYHYPIQQTCLHLSIATTSAWLFSITTFILALMVAILSWRFVENPALRQKHWRPAIIKSR